jgi:predicted alpha/beta-hydrolase family hydrolase
MRMKALDYITWFNAQPWKRVSVAGLLISFAFVGYIAFWTLRGNGWVPLIDDANFGVHEAGHPLVAIFSNRLAVYGGTLMQLALPAVCTFEFWRRRDTLSFALCGIWLGQSLLSVARYMADARAMQLPLAGFSEHALHDWNLILSRWGLLQQDVLLASEAAHRGLVRHRRELGLYRVSSGARMTRRSTDGGADTNPHAGDPGARWQVKLGGNEETSAVFDPALTSPTGALFVCAHGAGGHMADRGMLAVTHEMRRRGFHVVRFNFQYREKGINRPDPMPRLKECIAAVVAHARREVDAATLILGGRSMGGRAASMLAADLFPCDGLFLLAYPLHPAGQPEKVRDAHLPNIGVPVLCLNGTRDALCRRELMVQVLDRLAGEWTMHWLEGADHSFRVLKSSGRTDGDVLREIADVSSAWASGLQASRPS